MTNEEMMNYFGKGQIPFMKLDTIALIWLKSAL
jgi:hypothetical protein